MTEKEIYKARAEGLKRVAELRNNYGSGNFPELLDVAFQISKKNSTNYLLHRKQKIEEKVEFRKKLNNLFINKNNKRKAAEFPTASKSITQK